MVRNYKKNTEGGRTNFSGSQTMIDAFNAVMRKEMSICQAAKYYGVNKKSLLRRTSGEISVNAHPGRTSSLPALCEEELAGCIKLLAGWGWGFSIEEIKDRVQEFVTAKDLRTEFVNNRPGDDWLEGFRKRHPDIVPRKTEHLSNARARAEDPAVIEHWFDLLDQVLTEHGVKNMPPQIFNVDESGFVTDPKPQVVLAEKGAKRIQQKIGGSGREQITVNCSGSASGIVLPPYVVYKGKNLYIGWTEGGPDGAAYTTSDKGWMEGPLFLDWFNKIFLPNTRNVADKARILIFDGHASHVTLGLAEAAKKSNVVLLRLPAHLTHLLQPFDKAVFRPVKAKWQSLLLKFARTHNGPVGKKDFPKMLKSLYTESFTSNSVKAGFSSTGIYPFNRQAVKIIERPQVSSLDPPAAAAPSVSGSTSSTTVPDSPSSTSVFGSTSSSPMPDSAPCTSASTSSAPMPDSAPSTSASGSTSSAPATSSTPASNSIHSAPVSDSTPTSDSDPNTFLTDSSLKDFFLKQLQPIFSGSAQGRSARVERFRYGESLTASDCLQRMKETAAAKAGSASRGKGKGRGKGRGVQQEHRARSRSQSPIDANRDNDGELCRRCGLPGGDNWVQCDLCDGWFHLKCINTTSQLEDLAEEEWFCDFCTN